MTVIPVACLPVHDLRQLGHNLPAEVRRDRRDNRRVDVEAAMNRSLAVFNAEADLTPVSGSKPRE